MVLSLFPRPDVIREQANHKVLERLNFYKVDVDYHWWNKPYVQQDGKAAIHPIIHASWIYDESRFMAVCSHCMSNPTEDTGYGLDISTLEKKYHYCRFCGAKMDEEQNNG